MAIINLTQAIARSGRCSRRKAEGLIRAGQVKVNGQAAVLGAKIDPAEDQITVAGQPLGSAGKKVYYLVNKPIGYVCTVSDVHASKRVVDLVPKIPKVWPVGRLDKDSRGLIILTNDGDLTYRLTHPKFEHEKEYLVTLDKEIMSALLLGLKRGIKLEEGIAKVDNIKKISPIKISLVIHQGWKRQIRRMVQACGYKVADLIRIRIGKTKLGDIRNGEYREMKSSNFSA